MLRTVASDGTLEQFLPDYSSLDLSPVYCDAGTVKFTYPEKGVNFSLLQDDLEIAITMNGVEILEMRSLIEAVKGNNADDAEQGALWEFTARTAVGKLQDAIVYPSNWVPGQVLKKPKAVTYTNHSAGHIIGDLFNRAQARGAMSAYSWTFNAVHDSGGNSWSYNLEVTIDIGKDYLDVLKEFNANGWIEFRVEGRVIKIWDTDKMSVDRSIGTNPLHFRKGRDVQESPRNINAKGLSSAVLVSGSDNTVYQEVSDATSVTTYGRRESMYSAGSTKYTTIWGRISSLELAGRSYLTGVKAPQMEVTHGLHFETEDNPRPVTNFNIGDWALTDVGMGVERFRILQWVVSVAQDGSCSGSITMNWLFNTQLSQVNSAINKIQNGTVNAGSAPKNDGVAPGKVIGVIPTSATYFVNNIPRDTLSIQWDDLEIDEDGSDMYDLDYYQAQWRYTSDTGWRAAQRVEEDTTLVQFLNLDPGAGVQVRVRAVDVWSNAGEWSDVASHTLAGDTIAPLKPASPTVTSNVGTLRVVWSGLDYLGNPMPVDLAGVEVHVSTSDFTPSAGTKKDVLPPGVLSTTLTQGLVYGTEYWVKLVAFDTTGNRSAASDTTSTTHVVLSQVVSTEIGTGQVGLSQTKFSDVGNLIDDGTFELTDVRATRTSLIGSQHLAFDNATSSNGNWSLRSDPWAGSSNESILLQGSLPVKPGERVFGAADYRQTSDVPAGSYVTLAIKWLNKSGQYIDNTGAVSNVFYTLADNGFTLYDNAWHSRVTGTSKTAPANAVNAEIWIITTSRTAGTVWIDAVEVRKQIDTLLIQTAAITTALIADLAVNNAKINDVSAGKLTVGTLTADITVSSRIKTADTGARAELNSGGFGLWNSSGTQTVAFAGADGSVSIIGQLKSGISGKRIEINPTSTYLPEIRLYPTTGTDYAVLNAYDAGGEAGTGLASSSYDSSGTQVHSRALITNGGAYVQVVRTSDQVPWGGFSWSTKNQYLAGYNVNSVDGGHINADAGSAQIGWRPSSNTVGNSFNFSSGKTYHLGQWENYVTPATYQGLLMGSAVFGAGTSITIGYGVTMDSTVIPVVTCVSGNYGSATPTVWGIQSYTTTGFTVAWNNSQGMRLNWWAFRV
jgi:hypothetical protein